jgi:hypothetical protein
MNVHWRNSTNESKGKPEQKFDAAFGTISALLSVFKEQLETLYFFLLNKTG